jgi:hypothetical protein
MIQPMVLRIPPSLDQCDAPLYGLGLRQTGHKDSAANGMALFLFCFSTSIKGTAHGGLGPSGRLLPQMTPHCGLKDGHSQEMGGGPVVALWKCLAFGLTVQLNSQL